MKVWKTVHADCFIFNKMDWIEHSKRMINCTMKSKPSFAVSILEQSF